jgi:hypothetical protein
MLECLLKSVSLFLSSQVTKVGALVPQLRNSMKMEECKGQKVLLK